MPKKVDFKLADDLLYADRSAMTKKMDAYVRSRLRSARRFVLTNDAAIRVGDAIAAYPELLVTNGQFAFPPFETCWIEMPSHDFHERIAPGTNTPTADTHVGYLFDHGSVFVGARGSDGVVGWSPLAYDLHTHSSFDQERQIVEQLGTSRLTLDNFYWGYTMSRSLPINIVRQFRAQHSLRLLLAPEYHGKVNADEFLGSCSGEVRNIIGLLLMLNQPSEIVRTTEVGQTRRMTKWGERPYMSHSVIDFNLSRRSVKTLLKKPIGTHASPRAHEVRGHFAHRDLKGWCVHQWDQLDPTHWECRACGGVRWWRKEHVRGDGGEGYVMQDRLVSA